MILGPFGPSFGQMSVVYVGDCLVAVLLGRSGSPGKSLRWFPLLPISLSPDLHRDGFFVVY
jgi:hypothetical protein